MYKLYNSTDLVGNLEEFGLSKYEAKAYLTMIDKGSLAASEIAYYSNLPLYKGVSYIEEIREEEIVCNFSKKAINL